MTSIVYQELNLQETIKTLFIAEKGLFVASKLNESFKLTAEDFEDRSFYQRENLLFAEFINKTSRNLPYRVDLVKETCAKYITSKGDNRVVLVVKTREEAFLAGLAVARICHPYNKKEEQSIRTIYVQIHIQDGSKIDLQEMQNLCNCIRKSQLLMDTPCSELNTMIYVEEARNLVNELKKTCTDVSIKVFQGEDIKQFGGIYGVGKGATNPPALVVMSYLPQGAEKTLALVGKGIVYDTGGLSIKATANMCGMKHDMGGSAAVFASFAALVKSKIKKNIHGLLCLAENAVGPESTRNDDILYMYSGKTVEVNNTDAEGRLVLADGVAYASKHLNPDIVVDIATLTGAQMVTTGLKHSGVVTRDESIEKAIITAGNATGDFVYPMIYCPELLMKMFESKVADMKNSVSDRMNAQSSCAAHFVESHLNRDYKGHWLHIDMAGPGTEKEQSTGYGVSLLYQFVKEF
jgi:probable aminopeptidase NPEPL1